MGPCGSTRLVAGTGRGHREMQPSGRGQWFFSGAGTCLMLLQPSGAQGGLRNRGDAALGAHEGAEENAQNWYWQCLPHQFWLCCVSHQSSIHFAGKQKWVKSTQASALQLFLSSPAVHTGSGLIHALVSLQQSYNAGALPYTSSATATPLCCSGGPMSLWALAFLKGQAKEFCIFSASNKKKPKNNFANISKIPWGLRQPEEKGCKVLLCPGVLQTSLSGSWCCRMGILWCLLSCSCNMCSWVCVKWANLAFPFLIVQHKQGIMKCSFSTGTRGNELLPGCSWGQSLVHYFLCNNYHEALWKPSFFFPLFLIFLLLKVSKILCCNIFPSVTC